MAPSSNGLGGRPLTPIIRVRIPAGSPVGLEVPNSKIPLEAITWICKFNYHRLVLIIVSGYIQDMWLCGNRLSKYKEAK